MISCLTEEDIALGECESEEESETPYDCIKRNLIIKLGVLQTNTKTSATSTTTGGSAEIVQNDSSSTHASNDSNNNNNNSTDVEKDDSSAIVEKDDSTLASSVICNAGACANSVSMLDDDDVANDIQSKTKHCDQEEAKECREHDGGDEHEEPPTYCPKQVFSRSTKHRIAKALASKYDFGDRIHGTVYKLERKSDQQAFCVKILSRKHLRDNELPIEIRILSHMKRIKKMMLQEQELGDQNTTMSSIFKTITLTGMKHWQHMEGFILMDDVYAFVSKYVPDLFEAVGLHNRRDELKEIMKQLFHGLAALHCNFILHRDIKPSNLLWDGNTLTIVDYDQSTWCEAPVECKRPHIPFPQHITSLGTRGFMAPEVVGSHRDGALKTTAYGHKSDIFSAGVFLASMLLQIEEGDMRELYVNVIRNEAHVLWPDDRPLADLLTAILAHSPENRPSANEALQFEWFQSP